MTIVSASGSGMGNASGSIRWPPMRLCGRSRVGERGGVFWWRLLQQRAGMDFIGGLIGVREIS